MRSDAPRARSVALAITGASGALYATRTLAAILERGCRVELVVSDYGRRLLRDELGEKASVDELPAFDQIPKSLDDPADFMAGKILSALGFRHELYPAWKGAVGPREAAE